MTSGSALQHVSQFILNFLPNYVNQFTVPNISLARIVTSPNQETICQEKLHSPRSNKSLNNIIRKYLGTSTQVYLPKSFCKSFYSCGAGRGLKSEFASFENKNFVIRSPYFLGPVSGYIYLREESLKINNKTSSVPTFYFLFLKLVVSRHIIIF